MKKHYFCFLLFFLLSQVLFNSCRTIKTVEYEYKKETITEEIRILQISDFHSNDFGKNEDELISKIKKTNPDIILLTGDLFDEQMGEEKAFSNVETLLSGIQNICPVFFVTGNHDISDLHLDKKYKIVEKYGFKVLHDEVIALELQLGTVIIAGIEDPYNDLTEKEAIRRKGDNRVAYRHRLEVLAKKTEEFINTYKVEQSENILFTMLLAHRPEYANDYTKYNFDLIFSGHTHGGQWRFPPFINGAYAPGQGMFPKYAGGKYILKNDAQTLLIVSRGLSYQLPKVSRIFNNPELVLLRVLPLKQIKK